MGHAETQQRCYTAEKYLALERESAVCYEFLDGEIFAMTRASIAHNTIALKFNQYKKLPSLCHYIMVSQKTWLVEWYQLTEHGVWSHTALAKTEDAVIIPKLNLTLTLDRCMKRRAWHR